MGEVDNGVALLVSKLDGEIRVYRSLAGVGGWSFGVLHGEARIEFPLTGDLMVKTRGELVGDGVHFRGSGVGACAVWSERIVRQRITVEQFGHGRIDGHDQRVAREGGSVQAGAFGDGGNGNALRWHSGLGGSLDTRRSRRFDL